MTNGSLNGIKKIRNLMLTQPRKCCLQGRTQGVNNADVICLLRVAVQQDVPTLGHYCPQQVVIKTTPSVFVFCISHAEERPEVCGHHFGSGVIFIVWPKREMLMLQSRVHNEMVVVSPVWCGRNILQGNSSMFRLFFDNIFEFDYFETN